MSSEEAFKDLRDGRAPGWSKVGVGRVRCTRERCSMVECNARKDETTAEGAWTLNRQRRRSDFQCALEKREAASAVLCAGF